MAISPKPPPPVKPAMAVYPKIVVVAMADPKIREGLASGNSTLQIICMVEALSLIHISIVRPPL